MMRAGEAKSAKRCIEACRILAEANSIVTVLIRHRYINMFIIQYG